MQGRRCPGISHTSGAPCIASQFQGARCCPRTKTQPRKGGSSVGVSCAASTLEAEVVTPPSKEASLPSSKVFTEQDYKNFVKGYKSQVEEHDYWIEDNMVQGTIPKELSGTLLRNGPGLFEIGGRQISQPLDGDGMVCTFAFKDGRVFFRNRYVRTAALLAEQAAQKMLYRGAFSVGNPSGGFFFNPFDFAVKGIANTSILRWGGRLLALYERDLPYELDDRLHTLGQTDLDGSINTSKAFFGAHHRIVAAPEGRRLVGFNFCEEPAGGLLNFFEYNERFQLLHKTTRLLKGATFGFFHDMLVTEDYYVAVENPITMNFGKLLTSYMLGRACLAECLEFDERPTRIHLIPRPGTPAAGQPERVFETDPFFSFHHINAFEAPGSAKIVVDTCAMEGGINFSLSMENGSEAVFKRLAGRAVPTRLVLDLNTGKVAKLDLVRERAGELPSVSPAVNGLPSQHAYMAASKVVGPPYWGPQQMVLKVSTPPDWGVSTSTPDRAAIRQDCWHPGDANFAQEPIFVPRPGAQAEDDGWVLTMVYNSGTDRTELAILDAQQLSQGPVARICLPHHIPYGIHGSFTGDYLGPRSEEDAVSRTYNIRNGVADAQGRPKYS